AQVVVEDEIDIGLGAGERAIGREETLAQVHDVWPQRGKRRRREDGPALLAAPGEGGLGGDEPCDLGLAHLVLRKLALVRKRTHVVARQGEEALVTRWAHPVPRPRPVPRGRPRRAQCRKSTLHVTHESGPRNCRSRATLARHLVVETHGLVPQ